MKKITLLFLALFASSFFALTSQADDSRGEAMDIDSFVKQTFFHGVSYEAATAYGADQVPELIEMLQDSEMEPYWVNIAVVLEMIADERAVDAIISFIEREPAGQLSERLYIAKTSAIMGLGYLINRTNSKKALNYLAQGLSPSTWSERGFKSVSKLHQTEAVRNNDMSKYAILGLALAGTDSAASVLRSLQDTAPSAEAVDFMAENYGLIDQALQENGKIEQIGLLDYDRQIKGR